MLFTVFIDALHCNDASILMQLKYSLLFDLYCGVISKFLHTFFLDKR